MSCDCLEVALTRPFASVVSGVSRRRRKLPLPQRWVPGLVGALLSGSLALAQSPSQPVPQAKSQQTQPAAVPASAKATTDAAKPKTDKDSATAAEKVYTDEEIENLPPGGVSVVGPAAPPAGAAAANRQAAAKRTDKKAEAAYWKARYTAARDKLAQDEKALPDLQSQLETERVQQWSVDECTGQVNTDLFLDLLSRIDATKQAIQDDKQALSDLDDEFRKAGGLPGWIR